MGLAKAVEYALNIGLDRIWQRISYLANCLRQELQKIDGVIIQDLGNNLCGIVTFTVNGIDSQLVKDYLWQNQINVSVGRAESTLLYMNKYNLNNVIRASVHYYNTEEEIIRFKDVLHHLR